MTRHPNPEHIPEDLSINDQESIVEIFLEKVLGYEDAIEEYDDHDTTDYSKHSNIKIDLTTHFEVVSILNQSLIETTSHKFPDHNTHITKGFQKLIIPPPKV